MDESVNEHQNEQPKWNMRYGVSNEQEEGIKNYDPVSTKDIIHWSYQIALGMDYLGTKKVLYTVDFFRLQNWIIIVK